jgi:hypothetical protein
MPRRSKRVIRKSKKSKRVIRKSNKSRRLKRVTRKSRKLLGGMNNGRTNLPLLSIETLTNPGDAGPTTNLPLLDIKTLTNNRPTTNLPLLDIKTLTNNRPTTNLPLLDIRTLTNPGDAGPTTNLPLLSIETLTNTGDSGPTTNLPLLSIETLTNTGDSGPTTLNNSNNSNNWEIMNASKNTKYAKRNQEYAKKKIAKQNKADKTLAKQTQASKTLAKQKQVEDETPKSSLLNRFKNIFRPPNPTNTTKTVLDIRINGRREAREMKHLVREANKRQKNLPKNFIEELNSILINSHDPEFVIIDEKVWRNANIFLKTTKISKKCLNVLIKALNNKLKRYFTQGTFDRSPDGMKALKEVFTHIDCSRGGGSTEHNTMRLLSTLPPIASNPITNKTNTKTKTKKRLTALPN